MVSYKVPLTETQQLSSLNFLLYKECETLETLPSCTVENFNVIRSNHSEVQKKRNLSVDKDARKPVELQSQAETNDRANLSSSIVEGILSFILTWLINY